MRRHAILVVLFMALPLLVGAQDETPPSFDNPAIQDVLAMVEANLAPDVMIARVNKIGVFPELDGRDLAELKRQGVPDKVLLRMIELSVPEEVPTPAKPGLEPEQPVVPLPEGAAELRVVVKRPFRVTYYEVVVGEDVVHTEGKIWEGSVEGGRHLKRPVGIRGKNQVTAYSTPVDPGKYPIRVGFAVSTVKGDPADEWGEYAGEEYVTRGIRAIGEALPGEAPSGNTGTECQAREGQVCEVTVTFTRTSPTRLGGLQVYSVRYQTEISERR